MQSLSVIYLCKNADEYFSKSIAQAAKIADEIVIYTGSGEDSQLKELALQYKANLVIDPKWEGYGIQRQKAQANATCKFCLWIDSDEILTDNLIAEIKKFIETAKENDILAIPRLNHFLGQKVKHCGFYPDYVLRLHHNSYTTYDAAFVHEKLIEKADTNIVHAKEPFLHYTHNTIDSYYSKQLYYTTLWAKNYYHKKHKVCSIFAPFYKAAFTFIKKYFLQLGFLDGRIGVIVSATSAQYTFTKYLILYSYRYQKNDKI